MMDPDRLAELSKDPANLVYHYADREPLPEEDIVPVDQVRDKIERLFQVLQEFRRQFSEKGVAMQEKHWKRIKAKIMSNPEWKSFSFTHPLIYDRIVNPETTEKEIEALMFMIFLHSRKDKVPNGKEVLAEYLLTNFSMTPDEWKEQKLKDGIVN
ncbi:MAG: hypothetical protein ACPG5T_08640, partial [Endozoicomonas sp.]